MQQDALACAWLNTHGLISIEAPAPAAQQLLKLGLRKNGVLRHAPDAHCELVAQGALNGKPPDCADAAVGATTDETIGNAIIDP